MARAGDAFKAVLKEAAKRAAKSFLRYLVDSFGGPVLALTAAAILVLVAIYAVLPTSGIPGSNMDSRTKAVAYYQGVTQQVNPEPRASLYPELEQSHRLPVVSKLIAGHARIIMTLYYTKFGKQFMSEVMAEAERNALEAMQQNHRHFLMDATYEQVGRRFASLSEDAMRAAIGKPSAAAFVFEDKFTAAPGMLAALIWLEIY